MKKTILKYFTIDCILENQPSFSNFFLDGRQVELTTDNFYYDSNNPRGGFYIILPDNVKQINWLAFQNWKKNKNLYDFIGGGK